ncbi:MAG: rod shape-determining protein RodA [Robiginitomaculum sp.]|nr:MAG: rod shape-determining protein RodA [Robiginitomaculum sp.]
MNEFRVARLERTLSLRAKIVRINWLLVVLLCLAAMIGVAVLYSIADGSWTPRAAQHAVRFGVFLLIMLSLALIDIRWWMALAYPTYIVALLLLVGVEFFGVKVMGAQRWLDVGPIRIQPAEIMKLALVLALARYYHSLAIERATSLRHIALPSLMIIAPVLLILHQPDLGTAMLVGATGAAIVFLAGLSWRIITLGGITGLIGGVAFLIFGLHDYQRARIETFLNPERDPLGAGYHILQSKIALGSGGLVGKGFLGGTQSHLNFLPEKQTDFVFTALGEEFGFIGTLSVLVLFALILFTGMMIAGRARHSFGRLAAAGVCVTFALYVLVNISMVMGLIPVVGVPLPLISYGGTVMLTVMIGFALVMNIHIHRNAELPSGRGFLI